MRDFIASKSGRALFLAVLALAGSAPVTAREDPGPAAPAAGSVDPNTLWKDSAELSYVLTSGNSDTNTFAFKNKLWRAWGSNAVEFNAGGLRAKATTSRFAVSDDFVNDPNGPFDVNEERSLVAEAYYLNGRFDRKLSERFFWYVGAGWDRNRFSGIENRYIAAAGVGNLWFNTERLKWRTDYSVTYTDQEDVVDDPDFDGSFIGVRVTSSFLKKFGATTTFTNDTILDENLEESKDFRGNMINALSVQMTTHLALKVSLQWLYDHEPASRSFDLYDINPDNGGTVQGTVTEELDELDSIFTTSLVINF